MQVPRRSLTTRPACFTWGSLALCLSACTGAGNPSPPSAGPDAAEQASQSPSTVPTPSLEATAIQPASAGGAPAAHPPGGLLDGGIPDEQTCAAGRPVEVFADVDGDGHGDAADSLWSDDCTLPEGYVRTADDCAPTDAWRVGGEEGVCGDHVDDNCNPEDDHAPCPESQGAGLHIPDWDCAGPAPASVHSHARFGDAAGKLLPNACLYFFEAAPEIFYARVQGLQSASEEAHCGEFQGCVCPGMPAYDRRLYAFTWNGDPTCPPIALVDHGNVDPTRSNLEQPVSNDCRKYLYALHGEGDVPSNSDKQPAFELPYSYVAGSRDLLERRLRLFPKLEIACAEVRGPNLPWAVLEVSDTVRNPGYQPM